MVVPFLAYNDQWDRVTACHMTIPSHCHNKLPRLAANLAPDAGRTPVFPSDLRFWITMVAIAKSPLLSKIARATWSPNEPCNFPFSFVTNFTTLSEMDFFACLDGALFTQDPTTSFVPLSEDTPSSSSSMQPQSDIPLDEDRSDSGFVAGFCVIS